MASLIMSDIRQKTLICDAPVIEQNHDLHP
jgi:hypothetical protein